VEGERKVTPDLQSGLRKLIEGYTFQCQTFWEDDDGYRSMPKHVQELFRNLTGREVALDEFFVSTGGYCDGQANIPTKLGEEIMGRLME
jgi:hypothetical protein